MTARLGACLFLTLWLWPLAPAAGQDGKNGAVRYYVSNELGMALEQIGWYRREEFPYILVVEEKGQREIRTLFHDGEEQRRWEMDGREERDYRGSQLSDRRLYDDSGRLQEESRFEEGELSERTVYYYEGGQLRRTETFGADGGLLYEDLYRLSPDGRLRRVSREYGKEEGRQQLALNGGSLGLSEERIVNGSEMRVNRYDPGGRLVERETWHDGSLSEREKYEYRGQEATLSASRLEEPGLQRITRRSYDEEGRIIEVEVEQQGQTVEQIHHVRDEEGRILETIKRGAQGMEHWLFTYDSEGGLLREEYSLRGSLERVTLYGEEGEAATRVEELYRQGRLFMRIHYRDGEKVREEFLRDGQVVRTREFE